MTPVELQIWNAQECAEYLRFSKKYFQQKLPYFVGFPKPLEWSAEGQPRWSAKAVMEWALRQNYANAA